MAGELNVLMWWDFCETAGLQPTILDINFCVTEISSVEWGIFQALEFIDSNLVGCPGFKSSAVTTRPCESARFFVFFSKEWPSIYVYFIAHLIEPVKTRGS